MNKRFLILTNVFLILTGSIFIVYIIFGTSQLARFAEAGGDTSDTISIPEDKLKQIGVVKDSRLTEISGIDASYLYPDCYWVHNDSGNQPNLYLIASTGETLATVTLDGAQNIDWEDIGIFKLSGKPHICVADVGDNNATRKSYQLYVLREPDLNIQHAAEKMLELSIADFRTYEFQYPDGPRNCEALAIHPQNRKFYLIQKSTNRRSKDKSFGIYKLRLKSNLELASSTAEKVGELKNRLVTGASISRDNRTFVYCDYVSASITQRRSALDWERQFNRGGFVKVTLPLQLQGEAICFSADSKHLIVVSEKARQPIWQIRLDHNAIERQRQEIESKDKN